MIIALRNKTEGDKRTPEKKNVDSSFQVQLREDEGGSTRHSSSSSSSSSSSAAAL